MYPARQFSAGGILACEDVRLLRHARAHAVADKNDRGRIPTNVGAVLHFSKQRLCEVVDTQSTLLPLGPVGSVAEDVNPYILKVGVRREPCLGPI